ncbi:MAG TPA: NAD(P)/FAD-dependent oxidoreductase, partial [Isosphaeraceae bacterium]|nr:NAD(P)/FAD-dependent oxidoreductase [Isosphaeraceae bacterium]
TGIAGLHAGFVLKQAGLRATLFTADERPGGRILSVPNVMAPGLITEFGGEFIDSDHDEMLNLARAFGLELLDLDQDTLPDGYFFRGTYLREQDIIQAFRPLAARIRKDLAGLPPNLSAHNANPAAVRLDRMSIQEYLERAGISGPLFDLLRVAYISEEGLDIDQQSSLNLLTQIGTDTSQGLDLLGPSDERFKIRGGNRRIVEALAGTQLDRIEWGQELVAIRSRGSGFVLTFRSNMAPTQEVVADLVILGLPFSILRSVEMRVPLPPLQRQAIEELGYGTVTKLMMGTKSRIWRDQGLNGNVWTDEPFQVCFENSLHQPGVAGGLTLYLGGKTGLTVGQGTAAEQVRSLLPGVERVFPGISADLNGTFARAYWPGDPFVRAAYSTYLPGQTTTFGGLQGLPVGNLHFAGEHCNHPDLGYMNGAAKTGRLAAQAVLARVRRGS